jgi:hypothetical protein
MLENKSKTMMKQALKKYVTSQVRPSTRGTRSKERKSKPEDLTPSPTADARPRKRWEELHYKALEDKKLKELRSLQEQAQRAQMQAKGFTFSPYISETSRQLAAANAAK